MADVDQGRWSESKAKRGQTITKAILLSSLSRRAPLERSFFDLFFLLSHLTSSPPPPSATTTNPTPNQQFHPGTDVGRGTDDTLFALTEGIVVFKVTKHERSVSVVPVDKFEVPEGQRRAEVSRRTKRLAQFIPRAAQREALAAAAAAVAVPAAP